MSKTTDYIIELRNEAFIIYEPELKQSSFDKKDFLSAQEIWNPKEKFVSLRHKDE